MHHKNTTRCGVFFILIRVDGIRSRSRVENSSGGRVFPANDQGAQFAPRVESLKVHQGLQMQTFFFLSQIAATDSEFAIRRSDTTNNARYRKRYAVGPGFERPSRIVLALRLRKSAARVTPCFVGHRSKKQLLIIFCSLTSSGAP